MAEKRAKIVQSALFDKKYVQTLEGAKAWASSLGFSVRWPEETDDFFRFRQQDPDLFKPKTFRHWHFSQGVRLIVASPKPNLFAGLPYKRI